MVLLLDTIKIFDGLELISDINESNFKKSLIPNFEENTNYTKKGLMPSMTHELKHPTKRNRIYISPLLESDQIGLVGFDLRIGSLIARSDTVMDNVTEQDLINMSPQILDVGQSYIFNPDSNGENVYYVTSFEKISLSSDLEMLIDSKSTSGRIGCMTHLAGKTGDGRLIMIVQPFSFPIKVKCGKSSLSQAVIRYRNSPYMTNKEILEHEDVKFYGANIEDLLTSQGMFMRFDTNIAYRSKPFHRDMEPIDIDAKELDWKNYFDLVEGNSEIYINKKTLYLMGSQGVIELGAVCGLLSREQGVLTGTGAWSHLAGIFQPFWSGGITMEFYSHEKRRIVNGSGAGYVKFDKIDGRIEPIKKGNYQNQKPPMLPKMFRCDK